MQHIKNTYRIIQGDYVDIRSLIQNEDLYVGFVEGDARPYILLYNPEINSWGFYIIEYLTRLGKTPTNFLYDNTREQAIENAWTKQKQLYCATDFNALMELLFTKANKVR